MGTVHQIRCAHCKQHHQTALDVQFCAMAQRSQFGPVRTFGYAANVRNAPAPAPSTPRPWPLVTPKKLIELIKPGRYAVERDGSGGELRFIRVQRPKTGLKKGHLIISTQHSERFIVKLHMNAQGKLIIADTSIDVPIRLVVADPITATRRYALELGVCGSCGKKLTDERSRYYGIGPECEKSWPEVIEEVNDEKGVYSR